MIERFDTDFEYFWNLIDQKYNFAYARYADGEVRLMRGDAVHDNSQAYLVDKWKAPQSMTKVGRDLLDTISHIEDNFYYAISGTNDSIDDYNFLRTHIKQIPERITFANLWINNNYKKTLQKYSSLSREVFLICNEKARKENFPFKVVDVTPFPNDCINYWESSGEEFITNLTKKFNTLQNTLVFVSCGPISEIIIHRLFISNSNNTYIDVGSSIDEYVHGYKTRPYMIGSSEYATFISRF